MACWFLPKAGVRSVWKGALRRACSSVRKNRARDVQVKKQEKWEQRHTGDVKGVMVKGGSNSMEHGASGRTAEDKLRTGKA